MAKKKSPVEEAIAESENEDHSGGEIIVEEDLIEDSLSGLCNFVNLLLIPTVRNILHYDSILSFPDTRPASQSPCHLASQSGICKMILTKVENLPERM